MRRSTPRNGAVAEMADVPTFAELITKFDKSLKKNGYL